MPLLYSHDTLSFKQYFSKPYKCRTWNCRSQQQLSCMQKIGETLARVPFLCPKNLRITQVKYHVSQLMKKLESFQKGVVCWECFNYLKTFANITLCQNLLKQQSQIRIGFLQHSIQKMLTWQNQEFSSRCLLTQNIQTVLKSFLNTLSYVSNLESEVAVINAFLTSAFEILTKSQQFSSSQSKTFILKNIYELKNYLQGQNYYQVGRKIGNMLKSLTEKNGFIFQERKRSFLSHEKNQPSNDFIWPKTQVPRVREKRIMKRS